MNYHLSISLEMMYWPLVEAHIMYLQRKDRSAAQSLFPSSGWNNNLFFICRFVYINYIVL